MCKNKKGRSKNKEVVKMENCLTVNKSLTEFIQAHRTKINSITPHNPTIGKDDEWRNEDCWDELYRKKTKK